MLWMATCREPLTSSLPPAHSTMLCVHYVTMCQNKCS